MLLSRSSSLRDKLNKVKRSKTQKMYSIDGNWKVFTFSFDRCSMAASLTYMILLKFAHPIKIERKNRSYEVGCKRNRYWPPGRWKFLEKKWLQFIRRMQGENVGRAFVASFPLAIELLTFPSDREESETCG